MKEMLIKKEDGSLEPFETKKLLNSLVRAGASPEHAAHIMDRITGVIENHPDHFYLAKDVYHEAFSLLKKKSKSAAAKYSLRKSIMDLGPTGFPFEKYLAEVFKAKGYNAITGQIVMGSCVPHEIDVVAWKKGKLTMIEAKYHGTKESKSDLKVILYVKARYDDLKNNIYEFGSEQMPFGEGWLVTNTKFTETAITYGECNKIKMVSWNYPIEGNLQDMIDETALYPITCITSLDEKEKQGLIERGVMLCKNIYDHIPVLKEIGVPDTKIPEIIEEISEIIKPTFKAE